LNAAKISALDYLMSNVDRHENNIRIKPDNKFLAIDHELAFNYPVSRHEYTNNTWKDSIVSNGLQNYLNHFDKSHVESLKKWWKESSPKILDAHNKDTNLIRDDYVREHTARNFKDRFDTISEWANSTSQDTPWGYLASSRKLLGVSYSDEVLKHANQLIQKLPKDAGMAIDALIKSSGNSKLNHTQRAILRRTAEHIIENQPAGGLVRLYDKYRTKKESNIGGYSPLYFILSMISQSVDPRTRSSLTDDAEIEERRHAFNELYKIHEKDKKYLPPIWVKRIRKVVPV
jgi:hypothetical protein